MNKQPPKSNLAKDIVFDPLQSEGLAKKIIESRRGGAKGLDIGLPPRINRHILPLRAADLIVVAGYTSNYKSGLMSYISRKVVKQIENNPDDIVIYISWEQSVEEQVCVDIAHAMPIDVSKFYTGDLSDREWKRMLAKALDRAASPMWIVGHSERNARRRPRLTLTDVGRALEFIVDIQKRNVRLIVLDYLQRISRADIKSHQVRVQFMELIDRTKDMGYAFQCPVLLGTQSSRDTLKRKFKLPQVDEGQETSNLEQSADKYFGVWYPKQSDPWGSTIEIGNESYQVNNNLLVLGLLKQKYGPAPFIVPLHVKPEINELYDMGSAP